MREPAALTLDAMAVNSDRTELASLTRQLAHEVQAPITSLELRLEALKAELPESDAVADCVHELESLKQLVTSLLLFGLYVSGRRRKGYVYGLGRKAARCGSGWLMCMQRRG